MNIDDLEPVSYKEIYPDPDWKFWDFFRPAGDGPAHVVVGKGWGDVPCWCGEYHDE